VIVPLALALLSLAGALHVTLPKGEVNGMPLLGQTAPAVLAGLGTPTSVERYPARRDLVYGPAPHPRLEVIFAGLSAHPDEQRAWAIFVAEPSATVRGVGRPLARPPADVAPLLVAIGLRSGRPYHCDARGCFGTFFGDGGTRRIVYGVQHGYRYFGVQVWPNP
jgi:hypothetical protein